MKGLTINRIASAGLRADGRSYRRLALGIMASIFLISTMLLCAQGIMQAQARRLDEMTGKQDMILLDSELGDTELRDMNLFDRIGTIMVTASLGDTEIYMGYYDDVAGELLGRKCIQGRLPTAPGEIAAEQNALDALRLECAVGDRVTLSLTPISGAPEQREFELVGILVEQSSAMQDGMSFYSGYSIFSMPGILTSSSEAGFSSGRHVRHRAVTLRPGLTLRDMFDDSDDPSSPLYSENKLAFTDDGRRMLNYHLDQVRDANATEILFMLGMFMAALLLASCIGISEALEGQLARRTDEIGMLRAVGATRRQIRRIFGREAWLLALVTAPPTVLFACLAVWLLSRAFPEYMMFSPDWRLILPMLLASMAVILLASWLPLRRATRIMPMGVLRDVDMLRRFRRIKPRKRYDVARLISWRQIALHPSRLAGASLLVCMMIVVAYMGALMGARLIGENDSRSADFELYRQAGYFTADFTNDASDNNLNEGDIAQLRALPMVESVDVTQSTDIGLLIDKPTPYLIEDFGIGDSYIGLNSHLKSDYSGAHKAIRKHIGTTRQVCKFPMIISDIDEAFLKKYTDGVTMSDMDSGRAVLVCAPTKYMKLHRDGGRSMGMFDEDGGTYDRPYDLKLANDFFFAGQELDIVQLLAHEKLRENEYPNSEEEFLAFYEKCDLHQASTKLGAVLTEFEPCKQLKALGWDCPLFITTNAGAQALGLGRFNIDSANIYLSAQPDAATELALETRITAIASRGSMSASNRLEFAREYRRSSAQQFAMFTAIAIIIMVSAVSLIAGGISRRIRADMRSIGTIRAVGADGRVLRRCYSGQVYVIMALGIAMSLLIWLIIWLNGNNLFLPYFAISNFVTIGSIILFIILTLALCLLMVRRSVNDVIKHSIVECIREM